MVRSNGSADDPGDSQPDFSKLRVDDLRKIFIGAKDEASTLKALRAELRRRKTQAARNLYEDVSARLLQLMSRRPSGPKSTDARTTDELDSNDWLDPDDDRAVTAEYAVDRLRKRLLESISKNTLINLRHSDRSRTHMRVVDVALDDAFAGLTNSHQAEFVPLEEPTDAPADEETARYQLAYQAALLTDAEYLKVIEGSDVDDEEDQRRIERADRQLKDRVRLSLGMSPRLDRRSTSPAEVARQQGIDPSLELEQKRSSTRSAHRLRLQTLQFPRPLATRLNALRTGARRAVEETGVNSLYAVFGFLERPEADHSGTRILSPLLMLPVDFDSALWKQTRKFAVSGYGDEPFLNPALKVRLEQEHIELPEWVEGETPSQFLPRVADAVKAKQGWRVRSFLTVGLFESTFMIIWEDLNSQQWPGKTSPAANQVVARLLAGGGGTSDAADEYEIDSPTIAARLPQPILPADSSQLSVLFDVLDGKSMAVKGPPGTGKSQTIANVIAAAMERGKSVLFVAEKMAALEVVKKRLEEADLGQFVLELHSTHAQKAEVYRSFKDRLLLPRNNPQSADFSARMDELTAEKARLNEYVAAMNASLGATAKTIHQAIWRLQALGSVDLPKSLLTTSIKWAANMTARRRDEITESLKNYQGVLAATLGAGGSFADHPWRWLKRDMTPFEQAQHLALLEDLRQRLSMLVDVGNALRWVGVPDLWTLQFAEIRKIVSGLYAFPESLPAGVSAKLMRAFARGIDPGQAIQCVQLHRASMEHLNLIRRAIEPDGAKAPAEEIKAIANVLARQGMKRVSDLPAREAALQDEIRKLSELDHSIDGLLSEMRCRFRVDSHNLSALGQVSSLLTKVAKEALEYRSPRLREAAILQAIAGWQSLVERIEMYRIRLSPPIDSEVDVDPEELEAHSRALQRKGFLAFLSPGRRRALARWRELGGGRERPDFDRAADELNAMAGISRARIQLREDELLQDLAGTKFAGDKTDFQALRQAAELVQAVQKVVSRDIAATSRLSWFIENASADLVLRVKLFFESGNGPDFQLIGSMKEGQTIGDAIEQRQRALAEVESVAKNASGHHLRVEATMDDLTTAANSLEELAKIHEELRVLGQVCQQLQDAGIDPFRDLDAASRTAKFHVQLLGLMHPSVSHQVISELTDGDLQSRLHQLRRQAEQLKSATEDAWALYQEIPRTAGGEVPGSRLREIADSVDSSLASRGALADWSLLLRSRDQAISAETASVIAAFDESSSRFDLPAVWEQIYWRSAVDAEYRSSPLLRQSDGHTLESARARIKHLDREMMGLAKHKIRSELANKRGPRGVDSGQASVWTEEALIDRLAQQTRPRVAVRDFMERAISASVALKPCFMMSPASIARYLPRGTTLFDLVIIDEASQVKAEEAIGAIARGRQAVVVGDPMQLPPTTFFIRVGMDDEGDQELGIDEESILDLALGTFRPIRDLRWHYRSQHHSLIRFSNHHFYENRLVVFPSPTDVAQGELGVRYAHLPDALYQGGVDGKKGGVNPDEARAVAEAAVKAMTERPTWSLGVAATNKAQADLIEDEVAVLAATSSAARRYINEHEGTLEPFFVKNLENVQGDERDHIIISTVYGKSSATGTVRQTFGPIVGAHGHRRLNVLYTRARRRVDVLSSMTSADIHLTDTSSRGARALKGYLEYAATGVLEQGVASVRNQPESDFEAAVAERLSQRGFEVHFQVGVAGYRLDLAVRHPDYSHGYLAGIECDGATYHSAKSARDRDILRQEILERLGWTIYRIWSTDWFTAPASETQKLISFLKGLLQSVRQ